MPAVHAPTPIDWHPQPSVRQRLWRAIATPALLGTVVFVAVVVGTIIVVATQGHEPVEANALTSGASQDGSLPRTGALGTNRAGEPSPQSESAPGSNAPTGEVLVHVVGEVVNPGVVRIPSGSRVEAALAAAGGATIDAVLSGVNLARLVVDGEQIMVPNAQSLDTAAAAEHAGASGLVNLNRADQALLETLPRIGPALARRILDWRDANGPFTSVEQLQEVSGVGARTFEGLRSRVTV